MAKPGFIADCRHDHGSDPKLSFRDTYDECVEVIHKYFLSFGFELRGGKAYDSGNAFKDGDAGGFDCFCDVKIHNDKVAGFMHCDGDGPVGRIHKNR